MSERGAESRRPLDFTAFPERIDIDDDLWLDSFRPADAQALGVIISDEEIQTYIPWAKQDPAAYIERTTRDRAQNGPRYAIRLNDQLVGHFAIFPSLDTPGALEIGYLLSPETRSKGILSRVFPVCEALARDLMPGMELVLCINDENLSSQKLAAKMGYIPTETVSEGDRMYKKG